MASDSARRICVTGAAGQAGRAVVRELSEHGYRVAATDLAATREDLEAGMLRADLTDYGQAVEVLRGTEAVIHLANIPAPGICTAAVTFNANVAMNFNAFHAAASLGLGRVCGHPARPRSACRSARARSNGRFWRPRARRRGMRRWMRSITRCPR